MTRGQLRLRISQYASLDNDPGEEQTLMNDLIWDGTLDILSRTRLSMRTLVITVPPNCPTAEIPDSALRLHGLYDENGERWVHKPADQLRTAGDFSLMGHDLLCMPASSEYRSFLAVYVPLPAKMTDDSQTPSTEQYGGIPEQFHPALVNYGVWKGQAFSENPSTQLGEQYRILYEGKDGRAGDIAAIRRFINTRITPSGRRRAPRDGYLAQNYV
jgi:hypothetical protein